MQTFCPVTLFSLIGKILGGICSQITKPLSKQTFFSTGRLLPLLKTDYSIDDGIAQEDRSSGRTQNEENMEDPGSSSPWWTEVELQENDVESKEDVMSTTTATGPKPQNRYASRTREIKQRGAEMGADPSPMGNEMTTEEPSQ
ncbi:hypothetical protein NDU88_003839 [Pleurodeles waltl]|uniref:Uncharacterized protein n=1 Tax=Pleurodeles waltl TaxID=8319 RepID=A0AAV7NHV7_PLEWA|nr:hypothetical protein NDU88_003839 [Pleurodeles waltl]